MLEKKSDVFVILGHFFRPFMPLIRGQWREQEIKQFTAIMLESNLGCQHESTPHVTGPKLRGCLCSLM